LRVRSVSREEVWADCSSRKGAKSYRWYPSIFSIDSHGARFSELLHLRVRHFWVVLGLMLKSRAFSLGLPRHCGISSRYGSDRHLRSASAAVSTHPYGFLAFCVMYPKVPTYSGAIPGLCLCEDTDGTPQGCWLLAPAWGSVGLNRVKNSAPPAGHDDSAASGIPSNLPQCTPSAPPKYVDHGTGFLMGR